MLVWQTTMEARRTVSLYENRRGFFSEKGKKVKVKKEFNPWLYSGYQGGDMAPCGSPIPHYGKTRKGGLFEFLRRKRRLAFKANKSRYAIINRSPLASPTCQGYGCASELSTTHT